MEKEKVIAIIENSDPLNKNFDLQSQISEEIHIVKRKIEKLFTESSHSIPKNYYIPKITEKFLMWEEHVDSVMNDGEKKKFRILIFENEIPNESHENWVRDNQIRFIIEYVITDSGTLKLMPSSNNYSVRAEGNIKELAKYILDVLVDIVIESSLSKSKDFKALYKDTNIEQKINSKFKCDFMNKHFKLDLEVDYCTFSTQFRNEKMDYDIWELLKCWQSYLLTLTGRHEKMARLNDFGLIYDYLPKKYWGNFNHRKFNRIFKEKCPKPGFYEFLLLIRSEINEDDKRKKQLKSLFQGESKIGNMTIIPLSESHLKNNIEHLLYVLKFEKA